MAVTPFKINIPASELDLLHRKLDLARIPTNLANEEWSENNGVTLKLLGDTIDFWRKSYDWRNEEALLNKLPQYKCPIDVEGFGTLHLHFVHSESSANLPIPLLFLHGWPGSFPEVQKVLPSLNEAGFHVVAPSHAGYGFSSCPEKAGFKLEQDAELMHKLMLKLGYHSYVVQGGDWGSHITRKMALRYPEAIKAAHVNLITMPKPEFEKEPSYTAFETRSIKQLEYFGTKEFAYFQIQSSKPRTLGFALHDSPVGMLAWMADKLFTWSDSYPWSPTELITWTLLHYFPGPTTGFHMYRENTPEYVLYGEDGSKFVEVPTGVSAFGRELEMVPRSWAEKIYNIVFWEEHERGGHFAAYEKPKEVADDLDRFFHSVWKV
ncbi:hypothetical protein MMC22_006308 [Lobaria immixta]|nr:hypothetical protein [Lobaria immixta]